MTKIWSYKQNCFGHIKWVMGAYLEFVIWDLGVN
jgi:hypothetical protein